jgi:diketogulonate reductase-like aldo/keto reductase
MPPITYNQIELPPFMYGTAWKKEATTKLVELAVESGFKAIDTANQLIHYQEALVGDALQTLKQKGVQRDSLFIQTKFTPVNGQDHRTPYDAAAKVSTQVKQSMDSSLSHLHTEYVDSYVLHGPYSRSGLTPSDWEVWGTMEELYLAGKTRTIGISNVSADQLTELCAKAKNKPMVVQNRCYAVMGWDHEVREICNTHGIIYQGFSLLTANAKAIAHPAIGSIAKRLGARVTQVIFRFAMQIGMLPLTGTTNAKHMIEDLQADQITLTPEEMQTIGTIAI